MRYKIYNEKGAAILLALLILTVVLSIAFGISALMWGETKLSQDVPRSLKAYYAAEAGIERALYDERQGSGVVDIPRCSVSLDGSSYGIDVTISGDTTTIKSWGCYKNIERAIEVSY